jgi:large subunit ribosomal protein LP1
LVQVLDDTDRLTFLLVYSFFLVQAEVSADQINALLAATGNTEVEAFYPIIFANCFGNPERLSALIALPATGGGGGSGGGGGGGGGEAVVEEKEATATEEEVEMDMGGGMDMFAGDEGGDGGGDY